MRGPDPGEEAVSPYLWSRGFKQIDVVALTHAHPDHIGGLTAICENFNVNTLWIGREVAWPQQLQLEKLAASRGAQMIHELRGNYFDLDGAHGDFLWWQIVPEEIAPSAKNDDALVLHYIPSESDPASRQSDVLKVGHHASKNSAIPEFLAAVQPRLGVITSGETILTDIPVRSSSNACGRLVFQHCAPTPTARFTFLLMGKYCKSRVLWLVLKSRRRSIQRSRRRHRISRAISSNK